jgi:hypothetical protein
VATHREPHIAATTYPEDDDQIGHNPPDLPKPAPSQARNPGQRNMKISVVQPFSA